MLPTVLAVIWMVQHLGVTSPASGVMPSSLPSSDQPPAAQTGAPCKEELLPPPPEWVRNGGAPANYLKLSDFSSLLVTDDRGHSEDPLGEHPTGQKVEGAVYDRGSESSILITTSAGRTFTFTFKAGGAAGSVNLVRGVGNYSPETAMRYKDLMLPPRATAMLRVTPEGFEPLRVDRDGDGSFETEVKPDVHVTGAAAADTQGPTFCFGEERRGAKTLVTVVAVDSSGVGGVFYSLDAPEGTLTFRPYAGPFEVDTEHTKSVAVFADDGVGNRSVTTYDVKGQ